MPTSGCSGPSAFSRMARLRLIERLGLGVAALVRYSPARLLSDCPTSGCSGPSAFSRMARLRR